LQSRAVRRPKQTEKTKSETTTTPRVKKTAAPSTSGVGKATVKANREMDAADQLVAMINTTLKLAEKSDSMSGGFLKDLAKLQKKLGGHLTAAKMQHWLDNADNSKAMDVISSLRLAKKKLTALTEVLNMWQNKKASANDLQAALEVLSVENVGIADELKLEVVRRRVATAVEEHNYSQALQIINLTSTSEQGLKKLLDENKVPSSTIEDFQATVLVQHFSKLLRLEADSADDDDDKAIEAGIQRLRGFVDAIDDCGHMGSKSSSLSQQFQVVKTLLHCDTQTEDPSKRLMIVYFKCTTFFVDVETYTRIHVNLKLGQEGCRG
jgi:hypothetical protein